MRDSKHHHCTRPYSTPFLPTHTLTQLKLVSHPPTLTHTLPVTLFPSYSLIIYVSFYSKLFPLRSRCPIFLDKPEPRITETGKQPSYASVLSFIPASLFSQGRLSVMLLLPWVAEIKIS